MSYEEAISTEEPKRRLASLKEFMPKADDQLVKFASFLGESLNDFNITPQGCVIRCALALHDLKRGVSGLTGKAIKGLPAEYAPLARLEIPGLVSAVFPEVFAAKVKHIWNEAERAIRTKRK